MDNINIIHEVGKLFKPNRFGIVIGGKVIPVESVGNIGSVIEDKVNMVWVTPGSIIENTQITESEFKHLIWYKFIVGTDEELENVSKNKFEIGQLVRISQELDCIVYDKSYNFSKQRWEYELITVKDGTEHDVINKVFSEDLISETNKLETDTIITKIK